MAEMLYAFREETKYPAPDLQQLAWERHAGLVAAADSASIEVFRASGTDVPLHFGVPRRGATEVIRSEMGVAGELAYRELSAVAHGNPTALMRQTEAVPEHEQPSGVLTKAEGVSLTRPTPSPSSLVPMPGVVWQAYMQGLSKKVELFAWDRTYFGAWETEASREMARLLASEPEAGISLER